MRFGEGGVKYNILYNYPVCQCQFKEIAWTQLEKNNVKAEVNKIELSKFNFSASSKFRFLVWPGFYLPYESQNVMSLNSCSSVCVWSHCSQTYIVNQHITLLVVQLHWVISWWPCDIILGVAFLHLVTHARSVHFFFISALMLQVPCLCIFANTYTQSMGTEQISTMMSS